MHESVGEKEREQPDRNINKKYPAPVVIIGDPTSKHRTNCGCGDDGDGVESEGRSTLRRREGVNEDSLLDGREAPAADSLENAGDENDSQTGSDAAKERCDREERDAGHVIVLAAKDAAEPRGHWKNNGVSDQIRGENPCDLVEAAAESTGDIGQRNIGNGGVEQLHEGGQRNCESDDPRIDGPFGDAADRCFFERNRFGNGGKCRHE